LDDGGRAINEHRRTGGGDLAKGGAHPVD
jgi:hypothetical protein